MPYAPWGQHMPYQWKIPTQVAWEQTVLEGDADPVVLRFFETRPVEELYDTVRDPDNIHNLAAAPSYATTLKQLQQRLRQQQIQHRDAGILPDYMLRQLTQEKGGTIYELLQDTESFPIETYLDAADRALGLQSSGPDNLINDLQHDDPALRYWAAIGCVLQAQDRGAVTTALEGCLEDSHKLVRLIASWALLEQDDHDAALTCLQTLVTSAYDGPINDALNVINYMNPSIAVKTLPQVTHFQQSLDRKRLGSPRVYDMDFCKFLIEKLGNLP